MKNFRRMLFAGIALLATCAGGAQVARNGATGSGTPSTTRFFQLNVVLTFPGQERAEPRTESLTTQVAVIKDRPGSSGCKLRMVSQVPQSLGGSTKYIDIGTKMDCNNIRMDGDNFAMNFVLETSFVRGTIRTKDASGPEREEPLIGQRMVELAAKLPLDRPTVVFDSRDANATKLSRLGTENKAAPAPLQDTTFRVEMTASELK